MLVLSAIGVVNMAAIHIKSAKGAKLYGEDNQPVTVTLYSPGSEQFEAAQDARLDRQVERRRTKGDAPLTGAEIREDAEQFLADVTHSASPNFSIEPNEGPLTTREDFLRLYRHKPLRFIYEQLNRDLADYGNFTPGSPTN